MQIITDFTPPFSPTYRPIVPTAIIELHNLLNRNISSRYPITYQTIKRLFNQPDKANPDILQLDQISSIISKFLVAIPASLIQELIGYYDLYGTGVLSYFEFSQLLADPNLLVERHREKARRLKEQTNVEAGNHDSVVRFEEKKDDVPVVEPVVPPLVTEPPVPPANVFKFYPQLEPAINTKKASLSSSKSSKVQQLKKENNSNNVTPSAKTVSSRRVLYIREISNSPKSSTQYPVQTIHAFYREQPIPSLTKAISQLLTYLRAPSEKRPPFRGIHVHEVIPDEHPYLQGYDIAIDIRPATTKKDAFLMKIHCYSLGGGPAAPYFDSSYFLSLSPDNL